MCAQTLGSIQAVRLAVHRDDLRPDVVGKIRARGWRRHRSTYSGAALFAVASEVSGGWLNWVGRSGRFMVASATAIGGGRRTEVSERGF